MVKDDDIIKFAFDSIEDIAKHDKYLPEQPTTYLVNNQRLVNNRKFLLYIKELVNDRDYFYLLLDEIQNLDDFVRVLNGLLRHKNYVIYVAFIIFLRLSARVCLWACLAY